MFFPTSKTWGNFPIARQMGRKNDFKLVETTSLDVGAIIYPDVPSPETNSSHLNFWKMILSFWQSKKTNLEIGIIIFLDFNLFLFLPQWWILQALTPLDIVHIALDAAEGGFFVAILVSAGTEIVTTGCWRIGIRGLTCFFSKK